MDNVEIPSELTCVKCKVGQPEIVHLTLAGKKKEYSRVICKACGDLGPVKGSGADAKLAWHRRTKNRVKKGTKKNAKVGRKSKRIY